MLNRQLKTPYSEIGTLVQKDHNQQVAWFAKIQSSPLVMIFVVKHPNFTPSFEGRLTALMYCGLQSR